MFGDASRARLVRQSGNGRVTIPIEFRRALGIEGEPVLEMELVHGELHIRQLVNPVPVAVGSGVARGGGRSDDDGDIARQGPGAHAGARQDPGDGDPLI